MNAIPSPGTAPVQRPAPRIPPKPDSIRQTFVLLNPQGLHCRPAALLVKTLEEFDCKITVEGNGTLANARSIFGLLTLLAGYGTRLTFVASGPDAKSAMAAIQRLFEDDFAEAYTRLPAAQPR